MRQTEPESGKRAAKRCEACGCKTWLHDSLTGDFRGLYHFIDCPSVPGGAELQRRNAAERLHWLGEPTVPREQGRRILRAILAMMKAPSHAVMAERKEAILGELRRLDAERGR